MTVSCHEPRLIVVPPSASAGGAHPPRIRFFAALHGRTSALFDFGRSPPERVRGSGRNASPVVGDGLKHQGPRSGVRSSRSTTRVVCAGPSVEGVRPCSQRVKRRQFDFSTNPNASSEALTFGWWGWLKGSLPAR